MFCVCCYCHRFVSLFFISPVLQAAEIFYDHEMNGPRLSAEAFHLLSCVQHDQGLLKYKVCQSLVFLFFDASIFNCVD
jgi:hypothetical protein